MADLSTTELLAKWLTNFAPTVNFPKGILSITSATPRLVTHNFFERYKVRIATFDGSGQNPKNITCLVLEISATDQEANIIEGQSCELVPDH